MKRRNITLLCGTIFIILLGVNVNIAMSKITEIETVCGIWDCYTVLQIDTPIELSHVSKTYDIDIKTKQPEEKDSIDLEFNTRENFDKIEDLSVEVKDSNTMIVRGKITGGSQNYWGLSYGLDDTFFNSTWWNSSYNKRASFNVTDTSGIAGPDYNPYPIEFTFTHGGDNGTPECSEFIIVNETAQSILTESWNFYDCGAADVSVAVQLNLTASATTDDYFIYYSNTSIVDEWVYNDTYLNSIYNFWDFFDGELDNTTIWDNTTSLSAGEYGRNENGKLTLQATNGGTWAVSTRDNILTDRSYTTYCIDWGTTADAGERLGAFSGSHYDADKVESYEHRATDNLKFYNGTAEDDLGGGDYDDPTNVLIIVKGTSANYSDDSDPLADTNRLFTGTYPNPFYFYIGLDNDAESGYLYNITTKNYIEPNPSVTLGSAETYTTSSTSTTTSTTAPTTTTVGIVGDSYTSYFCQHDDELVKNLTTYNGTDFLNAYNVTMCEYNCSVYLGKARCNYDPFIIWLVVIIILLGMLWIIKRFLGESW